MPTNIKKAKTFLLDEYLNKIEANSNQRYFYFKAKCYHSFKKSEAPVLFVFLCVLCQAESFKPPVHAKLAKLATVTIFWQ